MRKLTIGLALLATGLISMPAVARATEVTTGSDSAATTPVTTVPVACTKVLDIGGPSRALHQPARTAISDLPDCDGIEGLCISVISSMTPDGPSRVAHRTSDTIPIEIPCQPAGEACDITVDLADYNGQARAAHQPAARPAPVLILESITVMIPQECQDVLSLAAIPATGSDSTNIIWLGVVLVGLGGVLLTTRRVAAVRSR